MSDIRVVDKIGDVEVLEHLRKAHSGYSWDMWYAKLDNYYIATASDKPRNYRTWVKSSLKARIKNRSEAINREETHSKWLKDKATRVQKVYDELQEVDFQLPKAPETGSMESITYETPSGALVKVYQSEGRDGTKFTSLDVGAETIAYHRKDPKDLGRWVLSTLKTYVKRKVAQSDRSYAINEKLKDLNDYKAALETVERSA